MSLLYECINGVVQGGILDGDGDYWEKDEIASLCVGKLRGMIVTDADPNCKCLHHMNWGGKISYMNINTDKILI